MGVDRINLAQDRGQVVRSFEHSDGTAGCIKCSKLLY